MKNSFRVAYIIGTFVSLLASPIYADLYKREDAYGVLHFTDAPDSPNKINAPGKIFYNVVMGPFRKQGIAEDLQKWLKSNSKKESAISADEKGGKNVSVAFATQKEANNFGQKLVSDKIVGKYKIIKLTDNTKWKLFMTDKQLSKPLFSD